MEMHNNVYLLTIISVGCDVFGDIAHFKIKDKIAVAAK